MTVTKIAPEKEPEAGNLVGKLAAVMAQVERVPKNGHNSFFNYDYATEADITDAVRSAMAERGIMLFPSVEHIEWKDIPTKSGGIERLATITFKFTATDGKDSISFNIVGEGQDRGDKATYKALTGATKYALMKLFLIPTGDDPETEGDEVAHKEVRAAPPVRNPKPAAERPKLAPVYVRELYAKCLAACTGNKELAKAKWDACAFQALGDPKDESKAVPDSRNWTLEQTNAVDEVMFPKDIPF